MGAVIPPVGTGGDWHQDLWEVLHGGGPVYRYFWIRVVVHNTPHTLGVGEPA